MTHLKMVRVTPEPQLNIALEIPQGPLLELRVSRNLGLVKRKFSLEVVNSTGSHSIVRSTSSANIPRPTTNQAAPLHIIGIPIKIP